MKRLQNDHAEQRTPPGLRINAITRLRRAFFSLSGEIAVRYGVEFDDVVEHLWSARCRHGRLPLRTIVFLDDVVHAIGCLQGSSLAWTDLREQYERPLIRQCLSRIEESDAIVFVRRYFRQLQQRCLDAPTVCELDEYIGDRPLRLWLGELISDALTGGVAVHRARQTKLRWPFRQMRASLIALMNPEEVPATYRFPTPAYGDEVDESATRAAVPSSE